MTDYLANKAGFAGEISLLAVTCRVCLVMI